MGAPSPRGKPSCKRALATWQAWFISLLVQLASRTPPSYFAVWDRCGRAHIPHCCMMYPVDATRARAKREAGQAHRGCGKTTAREPRTGAPKIGRECVYVCV